MYTLMISLLYMYEYTYFNFLKAAFEKLLSKGCFRKDVFERLLSKKCRVAGARLLHKYFIIELLVYIEVLE